MSFPIPQSDGAFGWLSEPTIERREEPSLSCEICGGDVVMADRSYTSSGNCSVCGSQYDYDEGVRLSLTAEQVEILKRHAESKR